MKNCRLHEHVVSLTLVVCLAIAPVAAAAPSRDSVFDFSEKMERIVKSIQKLGSKFFGGVSSNNVYPTPPKP